MEIHIKLDLPESFTEALGIDDDTVVESYIDNDSLHINMYAGDAEAAIFPPCSRQPCNEDCACCTYE